MAVLDLFKGPGGRGFLLGVTVALVAPVVVSAVARAARPAGRAVVKAGIGAFERGRESVAELGEAVDDVVAEVKAELEKKYNAELAKAEMAAVAKAADESDPAEEKRNKEVSRGSANAAEDLKKTA